MGISQVEDEPASTKASSEAVVCARCGEERTRLYQKGLCKPCLLKQFQGYIKIIDEYRENQE